MLGRPIAHSLSPLLHRAAYAELGLDWSYTAIDCGVAELPGVLAERAGWAGFSATMPLKHALLEIATEVAPLAADVGAANTLLPATGGWRAENTDVAGVVAALAERGVRPRSVTVLGAGGTAQAVLAALRELDVRAAAVLVRDPARTGALRATASRVGVEVVVGTLASAAPGAAEGPADGSAGGSAGTMDAATPGLDADLVVSTLPPGAADPLAAHAWQPTQAVFDVVYAPWPTALAGAAAAAGATVISGALLLLHQAAAQVQLMTGRRAPVTAMRAALAAAVPGCGV